MVRFFRRLKRSKGFTLIELVVVMAVIAILAGVSVGAYFGITNSANQSAIEQTSTQVKGLYQQYQVQTAVSGASGTIKNQCDDFVDLVIENGLENNVNYYVSDAISTGGEEVNYEENNNYQVRFIVTDSSTPYVATFSTKIIDGKLGDFVEESDETYKSLQEGTDSILLGLAATGNDDHIALSSWEYLWDGNKANKTKLIDVTLEIPDFSSASATGYAGKKNANPRSGPATIATIQVRQGKTLTQSLLYSYYPNITTWVSKDGTIDVSTEWIVDGAAFDFSTPIEEPITIVAEPKNEEGETPFVPVANIARHSSSVIKQVRYYQDGKESTTKDRIETVIEESSYRSITYFQSLVDAVDAATMYDISTKYEVWISEGKSEGCDGTTWGQEQRRSDLDYSVLGDTANDIVRVTSPQATIDRDCVLSKDGILLLSTGNDSNGYSLEADELEKGYVQVSYDGKQADASDVLWPDEKEAIKTELGLDDNGLNAELKVFDADNKLISSRIAVANNSTFAVEGKMIVSGWVGLNSQVLKSSQSTILGHYGYVDIQEGSKILNEGLIQAYGVIGGEGELVSRDGGVVESRMSVSWPSVSTALEYFNNKQFPIYQYHIDALKTESRFEYGSGLSVGLVIYGSSAGWSINMVSFLSSGKDDGLFSLVDENSYIVMAYQQNETNDGLSTNRVDMYGDIVSESYTTNLSVSYFDQEISFNQLIFPLIYMDVSIHGTYSNLDVNFLLKDESSITVCEGATANISASVVIDADADFIVEAGGTLNVDSSSLTIYEGDSGTLGFGGHVQVQEGGTVNVSPDAVLQAIDYVGGKSLTVYTWGLGTYRSESRKYYFERISDFTYGTEANSATTVSYYFIKLDGSYDEAFVSALSKTVKALNGYINFNSGRNEILIPTTAGLTYGDLGTATAPEGKTFKGWSQYPDACEHGGAILSSTTKVSNVYLYPAFETTPAAE